MREQRENYRCDRCQKLVVVAFGTRPPEWGDLNLIGEKALAADVCAECRQWLEDNVKFRELKRPIVVEKKESASA